MKQQLTQYIDLLFAGVPDAEDIKQEILQNTLDRYDDLISQGKSPEAAYRLSISGIGDISELLGTEKDSSASPVSAAETPKASRNASLARAAAIIFFILCPVPVIILQNTIGVCLLLAMVAAGVGLLVFYSKETTQSSAPADKRSPLHKTLHGITWGIGFGIYFCVSFATGAWYITWLIFPIITCTCSLISACFDLNKLFLNAIVRIVIFIVLLAVLVTCLLGGILGAEIHSFFSEEYTEFEGTLSSSGQISAQQIRDVEIQWVSGSITLQPGDTQDILFSETGASSEDDKMVWKQSGDRLIIQFCKPKLNISLFGTNNSSSKDLVVTFPKEWLCDELDIDSVSAKIRVSQLQAAEVELVNVSGDCVFTDCSITDFSSETVSGKVDFTGKLDSVDFTTVSANCTLTLVGNPKEVDLESVSGNLTLVLPKNCGFTLELESVSGDFTSDYAFKKENSRYICGEGSCGISADTVSGDIRIKAPQ